MNDAKTDALLVLLGAGKRAAEELRRTHDYNAFVRTDRECEGCNVILALESALQKGRHALEGKETNAHLQDS